MSRFLYTSNVRDCIIQAVHNMEWNNTLVFFHVLLAKIRMVRNKKRSSIRMTVIFSANEFYVKYQLV